MNQELGTSDLPADLKNDPSRNKYYLLPFLLGLAGMFYQLNRDNKNWGIILLLFIMTGIAIVVYLNQYPNQPRERDYAYAGSFYFYAVWIGLGVLALFEGLIKTYKRENCCSGGRIIMLSCSSCDYGVPKTGMIMTGQDDTLQGMWQIIILIPVLLMRYSLQTEIMIPSLSGMPRRWKM